METAYQTELSEDPSRRGKKKHRHSAWSTKVLKEWLSSHRAHPYPTEDEKTELGEATGMTRRQISYWFVNARRRHIVSRLDQAEEQLAESPSSALPVTETPDVKSWSDMAPLERWRRSPPEFEPVPWEVINDSLKDSLSSYASEPDLRHAVASRSLNSSDSSGYSVSSESSVNSFSSESLLGLHGYGCRPERRPRRRRSTLHRSRLTSLKNDDGRIFQCTFCTDTFTSRYDWTRHEGSIHLVLEKWTCLPLGPRYSEPGEDAIRCSLCDEVNPTDQHLVSHGAGQCYSKPSSKRSFYRRDHLRQHLRTSHHVYDILPSMKQWKSKVTRVKSRCGFCDSTFSLWSDRNDHIAEHFRAGAKMKDWKGCRGLEPAVALLVKHAIPPYLIGIESNDIEPFSGSRAALQAGKSCAEALPTPFESLTARLGEFVQTKAAEGKSISDEMLQREARIILYDDEDPLNNTPADNLAWLKLFKQGYGLDAPINLRNLQCSLETSADSAVQVSTQTELPFSLEKMQQAAVSNSTRIPLDLCAGSSQSQADGNFSIPWSWQTPECLAEFSQMCQIPNEESAANPINGLLATQNECLPTSSGHDVGLNMLFEQSSAVLHNFTTPAYLDDGQPDDTYIDMHFQGDSFEFA
ncbi:uncharacterized protein TrAFT101_008301 [Trichoderma asperellum]|uniref:uncharacterized protein n=1 Tax=Trichoderma asperellum TaxID=101201 RepID=UPI00332F2A21|nr:hypothetical protein TrAFT101_008301 [Trichoderma asperellum]